MTDGEGVALSVKHTVLPRKICYPSLAKHTNTLPPHKYTTHPPRILTSPPHQTHYPLGEAGFILGEVLCEGVVYLRRGSSVFCEGRGKYCLRGDTVCFASGGDSMFYWGGEVSHILWGQCGLRAREYVLRWGQNTLNPYKTQTSSPNKT